MVCLYFLQTKKPVIQLVLIEKMLLSSHATFHLQIALLESQLVRRASTFLKMGKLHVIHVVVSKLGLLVDQWHQMVFQMGTKKTIFGLLANAV